MLRVRLRSLHRRRVVLIAGDNTIVAQILVPSIVNAINLIIHRHMAHSTISVHFAQLTTFVMVFDHAVVFGSKLAPLHIWIVQTIVVVTILV